ncbi:unnamed protein product [Tuber melanosporum]|jgi:hypothetical protein|uniref:(Perigord truffle) hypothetical protein n=1 Tax=Tuber melanosporum (strain Mel28) TaxID=656061 RepID=D5G6T1_TUBMM|nr:uncharacterized protein GSTUM_00002256001 [Tuber melanosporum]CAZ80224.1 unnamed protein product [Tuber melanosporum]
MKFLALLPFLSAIVSALDVQGTFAPSPLLPNPSTLPPSTSLTLTTTGTTKRTLIRRDNTFSFRDVPEGSYLLDVQCQTHQFAPLRVDVNGQGEVVVHQTFRGNEWRNKGERKSYPIEIQPVRPIDYYVVRESFNPTKLLGSPMVLIALFTLVMIVMLPKLMDQMDPEFKAELEAQQRKGGVNPAVNFDVASFLAGTSSPATGVAASGGKGKKN